MSLPPCPVQKYESWKKIQAKYRLTPRELLAAIYICQGNKYGWIAEKMNITKNTLKHYKRTLRIKTRTPTDVAMLNCFIDHLTRDDLWH